MSGDGYLKATRDVLRRHGGLWFWNEILRDLAQAGPLRHKNRQ